MTFHTSSFITHYFTNEAFLGECARLEEREFYEHFKDEHVVLFIKDGFGFCKDDADCLYCFPLSGKMTVKAVETPTGYAYEINAVERHWLINQLCKEAVV